MGIPLISIIIPTRNRQRYANAAVRTILSFKKDIQVIVQDNSDDNSLKEMLIDILDESTVIYNHIDGKIGGIDNYDIAARNATGEYFCAIGDDDSLLPEIEDCALWMKKNNLDAVLPFKGISYYWPGNLEARHNAFLGIGEFNGTVAYHDPLNGLLELLKQGGQNYLSLPMPGSYHGLVKRSRMQEIAIKTGKFYGGLSPDMYSATCLSLLPNMRFARIDYPITLPGICPQSTSALSDHGKHFGEFEDTPHFVGLLEPYSWDALIPRIYSVQTIWAETMLHAIKRMGRSDLIDKYFDRSQLISQLYYKNKEHKQFLLTHLSENDRLLVKKFNKHNINYNQIMRKIRYLISYGLGRSKRVYNCMTIKQAVDEVQKYIRKFFNNYWTQLDYAK